jgi:hypothetical protein
MVTETVMAGNGAPFVVLRTTAYQTFFDDFIFIMGVENTCVGSGHLIPKWPEPRHVFSTPVLKIKLS